MTVINHKSISGITSITAPAGSDDLLTVHTNDTTERFRIVDSGAIVTGVTTASNFKTGTTNVHNVGVELAGINVLGADTPIGTGATIYNSGAAVFTGIVTAQGGVIIDGDNKYLKIGAGSDLQFVHTGGETFIANSTGHLTHRSDVHKWENYVGNTEYIRIASGGNVQVNGGAVHIDANGELAVFESDTNLAFTNSGKLAFDYSGNIARIRSSHNGSGTTRNLGLYIGNSQKILITSTEITAAVQLNLESAGSYIKSNQLKFNPSGHAYIDHGVTSQDIIFRLSNSSALDFNAIKIDSSAQQTHFGKQIVVGLQGGNDVTTIGGGSGIGAYIQLEHASSGINTKLMGNNDSYLNQFHGNLAIGEDNPDGNKLLIRAASTVGTNRGHIMLTGDSATNGEGPQIVFSESGGTSQYAGAYVGHIREGSNSTGSLVFGTRSTGGDANTVPTERIRIYSTGQIVYSAASGDNTITSKRTNSAGSNGNYFFHLKAQASGGTEVGGLGFHRDTNTDDSRFVVHTRNTGGSNQERLRITSDGKVGINDDNPATQLVVKAPTDDNPGLTLYRQSTGGDIASIIWQTGSGTQAKINYRGAAGASEGLQFYTAGGSSSQLRMIIDHSGKVGINCSDPDSALEIRSTAGSYTPILKISNHNTGAYAGAIKFESKHSSTIYETAAIYGYGGSGSSDGMLSMHTRGTERLRVNKNGQLIVTPSNSAGSAATSPSISIVQTGNYNGTYPGISLKSISTGGGSGMSMYCFDSNWDLYSRSSSQTGLAFLTDTASNSGNARMVIGADGKVCLGPEVYGKLSTSRDSNTALHIAGGGLSVGPVGNNTATREGGRYVLGWYMMSSYQGHSYLHLVTDLYGGSGNNYDYIMGGFHIHGHSYSSNNGQSEERIYFHNWGGSMHGYSRGQWGAWNPGNAVYVNSGGYVTIRLLAGAYRGYIIDLVQHAWYAVRNITVTATTGSDSGSI